MTNASGDSRCGSIVVARRVALILASFVVALLAVNACSSGSMSATGPANHSMQASPPSSPTGSPISGLVTIHIEGFRYHTPASVRPGARVAVMNMDGETHTVTADGGGFDVQAPAGQSVEFTAPSQPGRYPFHCAYHSGMHGVLIVG